MCVCIGRIRLLVGKGQTKEEGQKCVRRWTDSGHPLYLKFSAHPLRTKYFHAHIIFRIQAQTIISVRWTINVYFVHALYSFFYSYFFFAAFCCCCCCSLDSYTHLDEITFRTHPLSLFLSRRSWSIHFIFVYNTDWCRDRKYNSEWRSAALTKNQCVQ